MTPTIYSAVAARIAATSAIISLSALQIIAQVADSTKVDSLGKQTPVILVTSTRAQSRQTPVVYSELTQDEIQRSPVITDIPKMLSELPSTLSYSENGNSIGYTNLTMRGFDQRRIAVLINGIPQNDPEDHNVYWINFPDLASNLSSIQVQRGAGLVNYGAAAIGGSVNLTTGNFVNQKMVKYTLGLGYQEGLPDSLNTFNFFDKAGKPALAKASFEFSSGTFDKYALYARVSSIQSQGYRDQSYADLFSWFLSVARFDDNVSTQINVFGGPIEDGLAYTGLPRTMALDAAQRRTNYSDFGYDSTGRNLSYSVLRRTQEIENFSQPHVEVLNNWAISDSLTFKSSLFYYTGNGFFDYDASWSVYYQNAFGLGDTISPANAIVRSNVNNRQGGWIPRIVWQNGLGELTAGLELRWHRSDHWGKIKIAEGLPTGFDPDYKFYSYDGERDIQSAFARQVWKATSNINVNAELQVVHHRYGITNELLYGQYTTYQTTGGSSVGSGGDLFNINYIFANPRLGVNWNIDEEQNAFVSIAYTSREPRMNNLYAASEKWTGATPRFAIDTSGGTTKYDFSKPLVKPEHLLDIEVQWRYSTRDYTASVTAYMMSFTDELVKNGQRDIFGLPIEGNAPKTEHLGVELSATANVYRTSNINIGLWGNATFSSNKIVEYSFVASETTFDLSGNAIAGFPDVMANIGLRSNVYGFTFDLTAKYLGEFFTDSFGDVVNMAADKRAAILAVTGYAENRVDPVVLANTMLGYNFGTWKLKAQVNNLFNRLYISGGNGKEFYPAAQRSMYVQLEMDL